MKVLKDSLQAPEEIMEFLYWTASFAKTDFVQDLSVNYQTNFDF